MPAPVACPRLIVFATVVIYASALAQTQPSTQPARGDTLLVSGVIDAPADEIFDCFKTPQGIVKAWGVAQAKVDFRVGGQMRTAYSADADLDSPKAIGNTILAYIPNRMLAIKPIAPEGAPDWLQAICKSGWNVIELAPLGPQHTLLTITGMGYEPGPLFDKAYSFFKQGNEATIRHMQTALGHSDAKAKDQRIWAHLKSRIGGDWITEQSTADGAVFRARTHWESALAGECVIVHGWLGDASGMRAHALMLASIDPACGAPRFDQFFEDGHAAHGYFTAVGDDGVALPLSIEIPGQPTLDRFVVLRFIDPDSYVFALYGSPQDASNGDKPLVELRYRRVTEAPDDFRKLKATR